MKCCRCPLYHYWSNESDRGESCAIFGDGWDSPFQYEDKEGTIIGCYLDRHFIEKADAERDEYYASMAESMSQYFETENSSEKPNNCEHITEDGVTCAKYPACDDCLDNPLNKVKGSERLVKGSEKPNKFSADVQTYITEDRDTRILDAWQVKQMQGGKE